MRVEAFNRLESPCLSFLSLRFRPPNWLPIRRKNETRAGIRNFHAIAAGLVDVEKERLLDGVFVRPRFDKDPVLEKDIGAPQYILATIDGVSNVVKATLHAVRLTRVGEIVALVRASEPHSSLSAVVENDRFREPETQIFLKEFTVRLHINRQTVEMVESTDVDPPSWISLSLVLQSGTKFGRRLVPFSFVIYFNEMAIWVPETIAGTV
jgi:hypothetical protein